MELPTAYDRDTADQSHNQLSSVISTGTQGVLKTQSYEDYRRIFWDSKFTIFLFFLVGINLFYHFFEGGDLSWDFWGCETCIASFSVKNVTVRSMTHSCR